MLNNRFVYKYVFPNGKIYIGQTSSNTKRYGMTCKYKRTFVYNAMNKYKTYKKTILKDNLSENEADYWEQYFINKYKSNNKLYGYNLDSGGCLNKRHSKTTKNKISKYKKSHPVRYWKGKHHSEKTKRKISKNNYNNGKHWSDKKRTEMTSFLKTHHNKGMFGYGKALTKDMIIKRNKSNLGKTMSKETKNKIKLSQPNRVMVILDNGRVFNSQYECARALKVSQSNISNCLKGKQKTVRGYRLEIYKKNKSLEDLV